MATDFAKNEQARQALREEGDDCLTARPIRHFAYFGTPVARQQYREFLLARGYEINREGNEDYQPKLWSVVFSKVQVPIDIDNETEVLDAKAVTFGGEYDGWETEVRRGL
ncbi:ribonuclease E inhibitor RraB [Shinella sp. CPCC 100929]|uniref:Ribonuclease E inhibitor RraB n=1 Tax=Shinella lacus TaxID=2654216 RepID=A0ABT1RA14_9HYPH|nr:ribonuclease E inhibitor RraB [Shinella lacus]MCQ4632007.1 ribonuclease E inhibitor RraB [Shinella lacus]